MYKKLSFKKRKNIPLLNLFLKITQKLNEINVIPIIYGSLGLYFEIGEKGLVNDIDFVLKDKDFKRCWDKIKGMMEGLGYKNDLSHAQEFIDRKPYVSFMAVNQLRKVTGNFKKLTEVEFKGAKFYNFTLKTYLKIYKNGLKNKWRCSKRERGDLIKIDYIKKHLRLSKKFL